MYIIAYECFDTEPCRFDPVLSDEIRNISS
jgi:hypothetical protein